MFKYILLPVFFLFTFHLNSSAWDSTAAKYYPLAIGNIWVYVNWQYVNGQYQTTGINRQNIIKDTVINNKKYFVFDYPFVCADKYQRIDSITMNVYCYRKSNNAEFLIESLYVKKANTFLGKRMCSSEAPVICTDTSRSIVWGIISTVKSFTADGLFFCLYGITEHFGINGYSCSEGNTWGSSIKGCVINGVVYGDTSQVFVGISEPSVVPFKFLLRQNYPNPFNSSTIINYEIPHTAKISLKIYDVNGRLISTLVDDYKSSGVYKYILYSENLSSGVYFYTLETEGFLQTKKLLIIK